MPSVGAAGHVEDAALAGCGADPGCRRGVAEKNARGAVERMNELRVGVRSDHQHVLRRTRSDQRLGQVDRINIGRAGMRQVERRHRRAQFQTAVQEACIGRQDVIGGLRAEDERVDLVRQFRMRREQLFASLLTEVERGLSVGGDTAAQNPGIAHQHGAFAFAKLGHEFVVGQHLRR